MDVSLLSRLLLVNKVVLFGGHDVLILGFDYTLFCLEAVALETMQAEREFGLCLDLQLVSF